MHTVVYNIVEHQAIESVLYWVDVKMSYNLSWNVNYNELHNRHQLENLKYIYDDDDAWSRFTTVSCVPQNPGMRFSHESLSDILNSQPVEY